MRSLDNVTVLLSEVLPKEIGFTLTVNTAACMLVNVLEYG